MKEIILNWLKKVLDLEVIREIDSSSQSILGEMAEQLKGGVSAKTAREIELVLKIYDSKVNALAMQNIVEELILIRRKYCHHDLED